MADASFKSILVRPLQSLLRGSTALRESWRRIYSHASLAEQLRCELPTSVVVLGSAKVYGTGLIHFGKDALLYPDLHLETLGEGVITLGDGVVISRGVHLVSMAGITIGDGCMIGEYSSIRDANHTRLDGIPIRDAGYSALPIVLGSEVWIGRGAAILSGVTIGDGATVGANAVVTRDVPAGATVAGVPARPIQSRVAQRTI
jgi:acetyltransferase-like isoleucine patch superfamily enzyme